jgi:hypothetical protein
MLAYYPFDLDQFHPQYDQCLAGFDIGIPETRKGDEMKKGSPIAEIPFYSFTADYASFVSD